MAKPNYSFEKRQRELAKKRKKEDKAARKANPGQSEPGEAAPDAETGAPATPPADGPAQR
ncbi:MAG: hypothetical protein ABT00_19860 [Bordetella sp. SCN 68-11]|nr:MAG: hypothetical protein ABT00_19860 [Bordetella sp. SCN 68-11]